MVLSNRELANPYNEDRISVGCSLFGAMDLLGRRFPGGEVIRAITNMHCRGNGLGGGFAVYGLYPEHREHYAFHIMYNDPQKKKSTERLLAEWFDVLDGEEIPTRLTTRIHSPPLVWRYFLVPRVEPEAHDDYVMEKVMEIDSGAGAYVFSSGKDMGVFKGVGYPEDIASYFRLEDYGGYIWTAHGRFPTNTPGWWGGAHPFNLLDWTVVHNGEISSYGTNRNFLEERGYRCNLQTDTEVMAYALDLLVRRHRLPLTKACQVLAPPLWSAIDELREEERRKVTSLRVVYASLLMNGPFAIIMAHHGEMAGLVDRLRLRPLVAATDRDDALFLSSEEAAIRLVHPDVDRVWAPRGGELVSGRLGGKVLLPVEPAAVGGGA